MKSTVRFPSPVGGAAGLQQLELVTSVPFTHRGEAVRAQPSPRGPRPQNGLFRAFLAVILLSVATTVFVVWYMRHELPVAQQRAKESEALLAPPSQSFCRRTRPPMVCAHGGDTTHAPPNTVSAFRASLAAGADCVEVDAAMSRDGVLVVMHVRELGQLLGRAGVQVGDMSSPELLALRWPSGEAVMSVEAAVRLTSPFVSCVTLDVKTYNDQAGRPLDELEIAEALVDLVAVTRCTNCLIWAKSDRVVRRVLELSPGQRTGYIVMNETEESRQLGMHHPLRFSAATVTAAATAGGSQTAEPYLDQLPPTHGSLAAPGQDGAPLDPDHRRALGHDHDDHGHGHGHGRGRQPPARPPRQALAHPPYQPPEVTSHPQQQQQPQPAVVGVHFAMVEPQLLDTLHGAGKQLFAWTINQADVLRVVLDVGVDALVTNYPLTALAAIDSRLAKCGAVQAAAVQAAGMAVRRQRQQRPREPLAAGDYL
ncbi:hypothetical protein PLESTB_001319400 [Pleodorina starrii]|uniref:glycerophosphodiester phosphodiesterase n=1 Tax=Pleodorina starrii TaxID=330485 RepID=A0A9W6F722_9CHLO|nr:hypothetical protein PLESTM_001763000 [Pleodorina starrii]GLC58111.1 hypothetical protein PLESTB_001319400 [Pleodorina starrii]